jgi:hypothetical protein
MGMFDEEMDCRELIWRLRGRHQMWAQDSVRLLYGVILGFAMARKDMDVAYMRDLAKFAMTYFAIEGPQRTLCEIIERNAASKESENALFFALFDAFERVVPATSIRYRVLGRNPAAHPGGRYDVPNISAFVQIDEVPGRGAYLFHLDADARRCYELRFPSREEADKFVHRELRIEELPQE